MERVSVVIPCYNEEKFIEQTLGCFEKQTFKDFEIVIINDNSTDNTVEVISNYVKKIVLILNYILMIRIWVFHIVLIEGLV